MALVTMVGNTTVEGQRMAVEALASLALDNAKNQTSISEGLIKLLAESSVDGKEREKAARAISRFAGANPKGDGGWGCANETNQLALAAADGVVNESESKLMKTVGERFQTKYPEIALSTFLDPDYLASLPPLRPAELKGSGLTPSQGQMLLVLLAHVGYACAPSLEL